MRRIGRDGEVSLDGKTYSLAIGLAAGRECHRMEASKSKHEQEKLAAAADEKGKEKEVAVVDMPMKEVTSGDAEGTVVPLASTEGTRICHIPYF
ncbi:hypothetical protein BDR07DRAFT_1498637 [Suillus spraguei]|nr:hypothetical protein BDR07DRAFT_1498637 [Suillus spraguei]